MLAQLRGYLTAMTIHAFGLVLFGGIMLLFALISALVAVICSEHSKGRRGGFEACAAGTIAGWFMLIWALIENIRQ